MTEKEVRHRRHAPKVRTGCITCKIRRVKCDEGKPECHRCVSTGRKCDGYLALPTKSTPSSTSEPAAANSCDLITPCQDSSSSESTSSPPTPPPPEMQLVTLDVSRRERRALDYFYRQTAPQLSGFFSESFWERSLLQMSMSEPAIRQAMITLSALHEIEMSPLGVTRAKSENEAFALQYYNKAITTTMTRAREDPAALPVVAMTCILFICVEFIRGNMDAAFTHIHSGIKLLLDWREQHGQPNKPWGSNYSNYESSFIETELVPLLSWIAPLGSIFGKPMPTLYLNPSGSGEAFSPQTKAESLIHARAALADIVNAAVQLISRVAPDKYNKTISVDFILEQARLTAILRAWKVDFDNLVARKTASWGMKEQDAAGLVQIFYLSVKLWLGSAMSPWESTWDEYIEDFRQILSIAERVLSHEDWSNTTHAPKAFSFELGFVPALHVTAWKCRDPYLRRRAAQLLLDCPRREGLFDSRHFHAVFSKVIEIEEESLDLNAAHVPQDVSQSNYPPEVKRVHHFVVKPPGATAPYGPFHHHDKAMPSTASAQHVVTFLTKPDGLEGPWHARHEAIDLGGFSAETRTGMEFPWFKRYASEGASLRMEDEQLMLPRSNLDFGSKDHPIVVVQPSYRYLSSSRFPGMPDGMQDACSVPAEWDLDALSEPQLAVLDEEMIDRSAEGLLFD